MLFCVRRIISFWHASYGRQSSAHMGSLEHEKSITASIYPYCRYTQHKTRLHALVWMSRRCRNKSYIVTSKYVIRRDYTILYYTWSYIAHSVTLWASSSIQCTIWLFYCTALHLWSHSNIHCYIMLFIFTSAYPSTKVIKYLTLFPRPPPLSPSPLPLFPRSPPLFPASIMKKSQPV